jgi:hypothetical protein
MRWRFARFWGGVGTFHTWHAFKRGELGRDALIATTGSFVEAFKSFCSRGSEQDKDRRWAALGRNLLRDWSARIGTGPGSSR